MVGCATYKPAPLATDKGVLDKPDPGVLASAAAHLKHPRLAPLTIDFARPLTRDELAVLAVVANPDLKAARAKTGVADAQAFSAGLLPDPQLGLGFDKRLSGPDPYNAWAANIALELTALRDRRVTLIAARAAQQQVHLDLAWAEWQVAGNARLLAARIQGLEEIVVLDSTSRAAAEDALGRTLKAAARGDLRGDEVETRRIAAADAADRARQSQLELNAARLELNAALGMPPGAKVAIAVEPYGAPEQLQSADTLFDAARSQRLDLLALEAGYSSQEASVRKAILDQFPNLLLTVSRAQDTANNQTIGTQVSFTLPVWNRNRGVIAVELATREQLRTEYASRLFAARRDIASLVSAIELERLQAAEIEAQATPLVALARASEEAASRGDLTITTAQAVRQNLRDKQRTIAAIHQAINEQSAALETEVGASLKAP